MYSLTRRAHQFQSRRYHSVLHGRALSYLGPLTFVADLPSRRDFRSSGSRRLVQSPVHRSTVGGRAFPVPGPQLWNTLSSEVTSAPSLAGDLPQATDYLLIHALIPGHTHVLTYVLLFY